MTIIRRLFIAIVIIILLVLLTALFVRKEYKVERSISIQKPSKQVFDYVRILKNQENYNKWVMMDPTVKRAYKGTDGSVGFITTWDSDNGKVGKGEQEIKKITEGERIDLEMHFIKPFEGVARAYMITEPTAANQTKLNWVFEGKNKYPMNIMNLFIGNMLGKDLEESLNNLKAVMEK